MIEREISKITKEDVDALVAARRIEGRRLEYKLELPDNSDKGKKEFLADVSSFANGVGGDILFGVEEQEGVPQIAKGLPLEDFDSTRLRLQNIIREGIEPRLPSVEIHPVAGFERGPVIVVRVAQSWRAPHMVVFAGGSRFYVRDAGQRHVMDVNELRSAFLGSNEGTARLRRFQDERLARVVARSTPVPVPSEPTVLVHLLPIAAEVDRRDLDPRSIKDHWRLLMSDEFMPVSHTLINLEGLLLYSTSVIGDGTESHAYTQIFRNGSIEAVRALFADSYGQANINGRQLEERLVAFVDSVRQFRSLIGVAGSFAFFLAFIRFQRLSLFLGEPSRTMGRGFRRELLVFPEVLFDESAEDRKATGQILRPIFDLIWQSAGFSGSESFNADGDWRAQV